MSARDAHRREKLLDATVALILRSGVRRTSIDEIARDVGISKGAVYLEFPSKAALVDAAVRREFSHYIAQTCSRVEADPEGGRLSGIYRHSIAVLLERPFMRALYADNGRILDGLLRGPERYRPRVLLGTAFLQQLTDAGLLRADVDPAVTSHLISVLSVGPLLAEPLLSDETTPPVEATFELLADLVVTGLEPDSPSDPAPGAAAFRELAEGLIRALADDSQPAH
ncbi:TetR/AcrR family transcriptional regulator [Kocuria sabuli]|uniref:TetR/AcrR family transcriptional regulator n=1 Tax=Kocuria sabuli TaxID=3071448 RepID=UPI0034D65AF0